MTAVSAVIFLVTAEYNMATTYIVGRVEAGEFGLAIAYSTVLILVMLVAILGIQAAVGERRLGRRTAPAESSPSGPPHEACPDRGPPPARATGKSPPRSSSATLSKRTAPSPPSTPSPSRSSRESS